MSERVSRAQALRMLMPSRLTVFMIVAVLHLIFAWREIRWGYFAILGYVALALAFAAIGVLWEAGDYLREKRKGLSQFKASA